MKAYILDDNGRHTHDENHNREFVEVVPCTKCLEFKWNEEEKMAIEQAVKFVFEIAHFNFTLFVERGGAYGSSDWQYELQLGGLIKPINELSGCDSDQIELLLGVVQLTAFAGVSDIDLQQLVNVYSAIKRFIRHIHNDHREKRLVTSKPLLDSYPKEEMVPVVPAHRFRTNYPDWIGLQELLYLLPDIRGKSQAQIIDCLEKEWDALPRCKTCNQVLGYNDQDEKNGSCYGCNLKSGVVDNKESAPSA